MSRLWNLFAKRKPAESNTDDVPLNLDKRMNPRYRIADPRLARVRCKAAGFVVENVSFSGIALRLEGRDEEKSSPLLCETGVVEATLTLLDRTTSLRARRVFATPHRAGFCLAHETAETLLFLQEPLDLMRRGSDMIRVDKRFLKEEYRREGWFYWRGDSGIDLRILAPDGRFEEGILTFLSQDRYLEVVVRGGSLSTRVPIPGGGFLDQPMQQTHRPDGEVLRKALCVLLGMMDEQRNESLELFQEMCAKASMNA